MRHPIWLLLITGLTLLSACGGGNETLVPLTREAPRPEKAPTQTPMPTPPTAPAGKEKPFGWDQKLTVEELEEVCGMYEDPQGRFYAVVPTYNRFLGANQQTADVLRFDPAEHRFTNVDSIALFVLSEDTQTLRYRAVATKNGEELTGLTLTRLFASPSAIFSELEHLLSKAFTLARQHPGLKLNFHFDYVSLMFPVPQRNDLMGHLTELVSSLVDRPELFAKALKTRQRTVLEVDNIEAKAKFHLRMSDAITVGVLFDAHDLDAELGQ